MIYLDLVKDASFRDILLLTCKTGMVMAPVFDFVLAGGAQSLCAPQGKAFQKRRSFPSAVAGAAAPGSCCSLARRPGAGFSGPATGTWLVPLPRAPTSDSPAELQQGREAEASTADLGEVVSGGEKTHPAPWAGAVLLALKWQWHWA